MESLFLRMNWSLRVPDGSKVRSLGNLDLYSGLWTGWNLHAPRWRWLFLGAGNNGNKITCERNAGNCAGFSQRRQNTILDGVGDDAGTNMSGGLLVMRGDAGIRVGGGMRGGDIVVHGDVGSDPGAGMTGGRIIINGRCPTPPPGVVLRTLDKSEVTEINELLSEDDLHIPADAVCLGPEGTQTEGIMGTCREDLSGIAIIPTNENHHPSYSTCDTVALIGNEDARCQFTFTIHAENKGRHFHPCLVNRARL